MAGFLSPGPDRNRRGDRRDVVADRRIIAGQPAHIRKGRQPGAMSGRRP